jgi:glutamine synthetase
LPLSTAIGFGSEEADWESGSDFEGGNKGHRPSIKGGYFPVPPVDSLHDLRSQMCHGNTSGLTLNHKSTMI